MEKLSPKFVDEMRDYFSRSFYWAAVAIFESQFAESWLSPRIHLPLCNALQDYERNTRLGVIYPRAWLKSQICSIYYPVWRAMLDENFTSLCVLNTYTNATKKLLAKRTLIRENLLLKALYPERMPNSSCQQSAEAFCLPRKTPQADATFEAAGVGTETTSRHFRVIVEDDTVAPEFDSMTGEVFEPTKEQIEKAIGFHRAAHFLLDDLKKDQRIVVGTRWRALDLFTYILQNEPQYRILSRAVRENEQGVPDQQGLPVYPERFDDEVLKEIEAAVGNYMFQALMMNSPLSAKDMVFNTDDLQYYDVEPKGLQVFTTVDLAPPDSKSADPDYNVVMTAGIHPDGKGIFVLDYFRARCNPGELIEAIFDHVERFSPLKVGVETVGYQKSLQWWIQEVQSKRGKWFNVEGLSTSTKKKEFRIRGLQPVVQARKLFIKPWMKELVGEFSSFPRGIHDDLIDALAYQLEFWSHVEQLEEEARVEVKGRFHGARLLEELRGRMKAPKGFPYDVMGVTKDGHDLMRESEGLENIKIEARRWYAGMLN